MRFHFLGLCLCLLASATIVRAQPLPERRALTGRVRQPDGKPIPGALVTLARDGEQGGFGYWGGQVVTDANGFFSFPEADEDSYRIAVDAPGFEGQDQKQFVLNSNLAPLSIVLQRLADVRFRFLKVNGTPLSNSRVVFRLERQDFQAQPLRRSTDEKGEYLLKDAKPGRYRLQVVSPNAGYAIIHDLDVTFSATPKLVEVRLEPGGNLRLMARGTTSDGAAGQPLGGALLSLGPSLKISADDRAAGRITRPEDTNLQSLYAWSPDGSGAATRDGDGVLELTDLPPGHYTARLLLPGLAPSAWQDVEVKSSETASLDFRFPLRRDFASLEVLVRDQKGQPVSNTEWNLQLRLLGAPTPSDAPPLPNEEPIVEPWGIVSNLSIRRARSDETGRFVLFPLQSGHWRVLLSVLRDPKSDRDRASNYQKDTQVPPTGGSVIFSVNTSKEP